MTTRVASILGWWSLGSGRSGSGSRGCTTNTTTASSNSSSGVIIHPSLALTGPGSSR